MAISYEDALATLQSMFTGYTAQQLDTVLRHQGGHMENTVSILLNHGDESPEALMQKLPTLPTGGGGGGGGSADMDADERLARQLAAEYDRQPRTSAIGSSSSSIGTIPTSNRSNFNSNIPDFRTPVAEQQQPTSQQPPAGTKGRGLPTVLPSDFLRIPGRKYPASSPNDAIPNARPGPGASMGQLVTDEQLARMLQDELFQEELRNNPEFSHLAGRRNPRADHFARGSSSGQMTGRSTYAGTGGVFGGSGGINERNDFFDRLSELGDAAKRRLGDFAANWRESNRSSRPLFGVGAASGSSSQPIRNERRGLLSNDLNMDDEEEMDFVGGGGNSGRDFEMNDVGSGDKKKD